MLYVPPNAQRKRKTRDYMDRTYGDMIGERVGVFAVNGREAAVILYGYGVFLGVSDDGRNMPRIELDNGDVILGDEAWWIEEETCRRLISDYERGGYTIFDGDIHKYRELLSQARKEGKVV